MLAEVFVSALLPTNTMTLSESFDLQLPASSHKEEVPRGEEAEGCQSPQEKMYPLMLLGAGRGGVEFCHSQWNSAPGSEFSISPVSVTTVASPNSTKSTAVNRKCGDGHWGGPSRTSSPLCCFGNKTRMRFFSELA